MPPHVPGHTVEHEHEHEHEQEEQEVNVKVNPEHEENKTIVNVPDNTVDHVVQHAERLTRLEDSQRGMYNQLTREIGDVRSELSQAIEHARHEQVHVLEDRLNSLESKLDKLSEPIVEVPKKVVEEIEEAQEEAQEIESEGAAVKVVPEVETQKQPPPPKGLRERRRAKHGKR